MSLLLLMPERDTSELFEELAAALPGTTLEVWPQVTTPEDVEMGAAFWHMVDLVWVLLFPVIYLLA